ncbi:MAG: hypothetical protein AAF321_06310 [Pseudomonadota bacterium]
MTVNYYTDTREDSLDAAELDLYNRIMAYRATLGLPEIPLSKSLTITAGRHAIDQVYNMGGYNGHAWSDAPYDGSDRSTYDNMWSAPERVGTPYTSSGYEISTGYRSLGTDMTAERALISWQGSAPHNAVITNEGVWATPWKAIGIGMHGSVAHVWFGRAVDPAGLPDGAPPGAITADPTINGTDGPETLSGTDGADLIAARGGDDTLVGMGGADSLFAGSGNDLVFGGDGDDLLFGAAGNDSLLGGAGNDVNYAGAGQDTVRAGAGNDTLGGGADDDSLYGEANDDRVFGGLGNDFIDGGDGNDVIYSGLGNDAVRGGAGNDEIGARDGDDDIRAGDGADTIFAAAGNDSVRGDAGADVIYGGTGADTVELGSGDGAADVFGWSIGHGNDTLYHFEDGIDKIDLSSTGLSASDLVFSPDFLGATISFGGQGTLTVFGGSATAFDASDFIF